MGVKVVNQYFLFPIFIIFRNALEAHTKIGVCISFIRRVYRSSGLLPNSIMLLLYLLHKEEASEYFEHKGNNNLSKTTLFLFLSCTNVMCMFYSWKQPHYLLWWWLRTYLLTSHPILYFFESNIYWVCFVYSYK